MPALPFKLNQDRRRHIPEQKRKVTNWRDYDESLRRRGSLTVWFSDAAVKAWEAVVHGSWMRAQLPQPCLGSCDADGLRASQLQHAVQDLDRHVHLSRPTIIGV